MLVNALTFDQSITASGTNCNFITPTTHCVNNTIPNQEISVNFPNRSRTQASHTTQLDHRNFSVKFDPKYLAAHVFPTF